MNHPLLRALLTATALLFITGCQTLDDRIKSKGDLFARLDPATQAKIKAGTIELGFTPDLVFLALGAPAEKRELITQAGKDEIWIYLAHDFPAPGLDPMGYRRRIIFDPYLNGYRIAYRPIMADDEAGIASERLRVVFHEGKATAMEQAKSE